MLPLNTLVLSGFFTIVCCELKFPPRFKFGAATSAYQIEGAWNASDKGECIWDRLTHTLPDFIADASNGDLACDSYRRWKEDIGLAVDVGLDFYRFSISWSRLLPTGLPNYISEDGKNYYSNLIDGLLEKGIEPMVTIYHWELPQRLQNLGGWTNPLISDWFADYARVVFTLYADRVKTWITINEPIIACDLSYGHGNMAPGVKDPEFGNYLCIKHTLMAHAKGWRIYDKEFRAKYHEIVTSAELTSPSPPGKVTLANALIWTEPDTGEDQNLADLVNELGSGIFSHAVYSKTGGWPSRIEKIIAERSKQLGFPRSNLPAFSGEEIELVKGTYDFYAMNYYMARVARSAKEGEEVQIWPIYGAPVLNAVLGGRPEWARGAQDCFAVYPEGLRRQLTWLKKNYGDMEVIITENGFSSIGYNLNDLDRVKYLRDHLEQILLSINKDDVNVTHYTVWSLMDNFEWNSGYNTKFGLYEVDFSTPLRTRTPRASARYYKNVIRTRKINIQNHISDEL